MKLGRANEKAVTVGKDPLIQRGAVITSGRTKYVVESVRGSTITARIVVPWHRRLSAAAARLAAKLTKRAIARD